MIGIDFGRRVSAPADLIAARKALGLSQRELAALLRMGVNGGRTVRRWETGEYTIPGPARVAVECLVKLAKIDF